jgi:ubiquinone/menaquinone biosynthesis C-methylase UbiE
VQVHEATRLIEGTIDGSGGVWADLGCGEGTFTLALRQLLGTSSLIYAVDQEATSLSALRRRAGGTTGMILVTADFTQPLDLPGLDGTLDGILLANSLHFVEEPERVLALWTARLRSAGRAVFVEYDRRSSSRWVPYPISPERLEKIAAAAGLSTPAVIASHPSEFTGTLYAAVATKP